MTTSPASYRCESIPPYPPPIPLPSLAVPLFTGTLPSQPYHSLHPVSSTWRHSASLAQWPTIAKCGHYHIPNLQARRTSLLLRWSAIYSLSYGTSTSAALQYGAFTRKPPKPSSIWSPFHHLHVWSLFGGTFSVVHPHHTTPKGITTYSVGLSRKDVGRLVSSMQ